MEVILSKVFGLKEEEIKDELTMQDIERWDSLTHMDLITSLETGLDIRFSMDEIMAMTDIKSIKSIVSQKV